MPEKTALYRRYRPQRFAEVVGQEHVTRTLRNAIASNQVAHAYLLSGSRGTGKTSIARLIAKALNCPRSADGEPCDTCASCVSIREGRFLDLIEIDAASNRGIDEMRDLRDKVRFAPSEGEFKVYVIDEAHQLTSEAFNALLKTLEEPPPHAVFVLATTEAQRIPATIVSRTQRFDLRRISHRGVVEQLAQIATAEGMRAEPAALEAIARHAQGSLRDAESILDQVATFGAGEVSLREVDELLGSSDQEDVAELFEALAEKDGARGIRLVGRLVDDGRDLRLFVRRALDHTRALVVVSATDIAPETASESIAAVLRSQAPRLGLERLARIAKRFVEAEQQLRTGEGRPLPLELAILDLVSEPAAPEPAVRAPAPQQRSTEGRAARPAPATGSGPASSGERPQSARGGTEGRSRDERSAPSHVARGSAVVELSEHRERSARADAAASAAGAGSPGAAASRTPSAGSASPGAASPGMELGAARDAWQLVVEREKERSIGTAALLLKGEPVAIEGSTLVVGFSDDFARDRCGSDRLRPNLERDLGVLLGGTIRVKCITHRSAEPAATTEDPMLRAALETFRRPERILEVE